MLCGSCSVDDDHGRCHTKAIDNVTVGVVKVR